MAAWSQSGVLQARSLRFWRGFSAQARKAFSGRLGHKFCGTQGLFLNLIDWTYQFLTRQKRLGVLFSCSFVKFGSLLLRSFLFCWAFVVFCGSCKISVSFSPFSSYYVGFGEGVCEGLSVWLCTDDKYQMGLIK